MATVIERAADMLQRDGYLLGWIHEDPEAGIVAFFDPATLKHGWNGRKVFGLVRLSSAEITQLRQDHNASARILYRVREAEQALLEDLG